jgi:hypothetical protein
MLTKDRKLWKAIQAGKLAAILDGLPPEFLVAANGVDNLNVYDRDERLVGYIDVLEGEFTDFRSRGVGPGVPA